MISLMFGALLAAAPLQPTEPTISLCRDAYSASAGQARYRLTVNWNGYVGYRYDVVLTDETQASWPQFHDQRLRPSGRQSRETFTVSDRSSYPMTATLVRLTRDAADSFDLSCHRDRFCSLDLTGEGVETFGSEAAIPSPVRMTECA
jgi:hypothetical protein